MDLYHVTYAYNLPGIANQGIAPGGGSNFGKGYQGRVSGKIYLTTGEGVSFWARRLWQEVGGGVGEADIGDGEFPVVLRVDVPPSVDLEKDEDGTNSQSRGKAFQSEGTIPPGNVEVYAPWDGGRWMSLQQAPAGDLIDHAEESGRYYIGPEGKVPEEELPTDELSFEEFERRYRGPKVDHDYKAWLPESRGDAAGLVERASELVDG